jgi:hypothetical protein
VLDYNAVVRLEKVERRETMNVEVFHRSFVFHRLFNEEACWTADTHCNSADTLTSRSGTAI